MRSHRINGSQARLIARGWICPSYSAANATRAGIKLASIPNQRRAFSRSRVNDQNAVHRDGKLPDFPARTRFAPSPTGIMHMGGLRTALFSYLLARRTGGHFILRIEDTDQKRLVAGAQERLCDDLQWAGLQWDEGPGVGGEYGPYQQSERTEIYQREAQVLLDKGTAYRCFCTAQSTGAGSAAYATSGCYQDCASMPVDQASERAASKEERFTVRLKYSSDMKKRTYPDLVYGNIKRLKRTPTASTSGDEESALNAADTILLKSDRTPTYHFANVVDDHLMSVTHVIRGTEWMASTPLHYDLYQAFGWEPPLFAHVGLLLDKNKAKLSKRNADLALDVRGLRDDHGLLPETLCNFLALQGWSNPTQNDVMDMGELIENFDLKFTTGNTMVGMEKLWFLQKNHAERRCKVVRQTHDTGPIDGIAEQLVVIVERKFPKAVEMIGSRDSLMTLCTMLLLVDDKFYQNPSQFVDRNQYFFERGASRTLQEKKPYDTSLGITEDGVQDTISDLFSRPEVADVHVKKAAADVTSALTYLQQSNRDIHAAMSRCVWLRIMGESAEMEIEKALQSDAEAAAVAKQLASDNAQSDEAVSLVKQYKGWQKAIMQSMRNSLCSGMPGPSMGTVIAILGSEECRRRLMI